MDDTGGRGHDAEVVEGLLPPAQEFVALLVAGKLAFGIQFQSSPQTVVVHLHRVIDYQIHGNLRIHFFWIATQFGHGIPHRRQIYDGGNPGKVLHHDASRFEWNLFAPGRIRTPAGNSLHVVPGYLEAIALPQSRLEQHLDREGQTPDRGDALFFQLLDAENCTRFTAGLQAGTSTKSIVAI